MIIVNTFSLQSDSTLLAAYSKQEGRAFNFHYQSNGYHPLVCYDGITGDLIKIQLRDGAAYSCTGVTDFLQPILDEYLNDYPTIHLLLRGDSVFATPDLYKQCEENGTNYVIRLKENKILREKASFLADALTSRTQNNKVDYAVVYGEFMYKASPWPYERRVVCKCKVEKPENQIVYMYTFIVTNMDSSPKYLIKFYCKRGLMENFIKESKSGFDFSAVSSHNRIVNANRVQVHALAYNIFISTTEDYHKYVNDTVRLSLYGDFLYPLAEDSTLEKFYHEKPEGEFCEELHNARTEVWSCPAKFIHFGTTREILALMSGGVDDYKALGWCKKVNSSISGNTAGYNSVLSDRAVIGDGCYLEVSFVHSKAVIGNNVVLSYIDIHDELIPDNVVLHGLKQKNGKFVCRIYGVLDNPKENKLFGIDLEEVFHKLEIRPEDVWNSGEHLLWFAKLYPECDSIKEAVGVALNLFDLLQGEGNLDEWKNAQRKSLCAGFNDADASAIIAWNRRMQELVKMDEIAKDIRSGKPARETESLPPLTRLQGNWLEKRFKRADFSESVRLNYYIGTALGNRQGDKYIAESFRTISGQILKVALHNLQYNDSCRIVSDRHTVKLPLRVNWGGGWSDTPPICCEMGGTVLNAAISLNGELPVEVTLVRIPEKKIVFDSRDMDVHGEFDSIEELQKTGDSYDSFALQKACLLACGIIPSEGGKLDEILTRLGGGFEMHSEVTNVPKGSGLGTSSILSAACVKAVFEFMGIAYTEADL